MGILRVDGGRSGVIEYLIHGRKKGQTLTRDELDERVVLYGDLEITAAVIGSMDVEGQKYLHITFSVKERDLPVEKFYEIDEFIREKLLAAYKDDELYIYSELQRPRIKNVLNKTTGAWHERLDHIHYVIPEKNLITGKKENPIGVYDHNVEFFEAIQELVNIKFGLASPKDNARVDVSHADIVARVKEVDTFKKGTFKDLKSELINDILVKDIKDYASFQEHLKGIGQVKVVNAGKDNEYLGVKVSEKGRFINLREQEFRKEFFELPQAERALVLGAGHEEKQSSRMRPKKTQAQYEELVQKWVDIRSKEVRYLNSGSKTYKKYFDKNTTKEEKAEILAYYEQRAQAKRNKLEKQHDDKYRESGRPDEHRRAAVARDAERAGERIFAERAERDAFTRAVGGTNEPGLAVRGLGEAPKLGDRVHGLSQGDVAREQWSTAQLVQSHAHDDMEAGRSKPAGDAVQRTRAGNAGRDERDGVNPATGRTGDNATAQLLRDQQEAVRQEAGDKQPNISEIKTQLDAKRLLADLAVSHLLRPEDYVISQAADGGARIRHVGGHHGSMQKYNVSDFLTKHLHLNWGEAQPYLAASYERQKNAVPIQKVPTKPKADLWAEFQADRRAELIGNPGQAKRDQERQRESELARRSEINDRFLAAKASIKSAPDLSPAQRKAQRSIAQMTKVEEQRLLRLEIQRERAELKHENSTREQYRLWLQVQAQAGNRDALAELKAQSPGEARHIAAWENILAAVDEKTNAARLLEQSERAAHDKLRYTVERNGDVTYSRAGRELMLDTGRKVHMIELSDESVEQGLRLAAAKWGGKMQLSGTDEFVRQAVEIAARKNMHIEFKDPAHNAALQVEKEKIAKGREYTARNIERHKKELDEAEAGRRKSPVDVLREKQAALDAKAAPGTPEPTTPAPERGRDVDDDDQDRDRDVDAPR